MERELLFDSGGYRLEALCEKGEGDRWAVVTHPHPLYGGDMENPVVRTIVRACRRAGLSTFRFNFRGVGRSEGEFDAGLGEKEDVASAVSCIRKEGAVRVVLIGYSFGAWVNARIDRAARINEMVMVSPPVALLDFSSVSGLDALTRVITGSADEIAPCDRIENFLPLWNRAARLETIPDADHFYTGYLPALEAVLLSGFS
jgi:uncharacterized protein